jgi:ribosomal-protein-alanine N-acetyltransferase
MAHVEEEARLNEEQSLRFRSMRLQDIPQICRIEIDAFPTPWTSAAFHNELTNNQFAQYMVMEYDNQIIGYGGMWIIMEEAHVTNIAILSSFRGRKLGERLVLELLRTASFLGAERMTLEVRVSNTIARNLYEKLGFYSVGRRRGYYSDNGEDALIMWADLPKYPFEKD